MRYPRCDCEVSKPSIESELTRSVRRYRFFDFLRRFFVEPFPFECFDGLLGTPAVTGSSSLRMFFLLRASGASAARPNPHSVEIMMYKHNPEANLKKIKHMNSIMNFMTDCCICCCSSCGGGVNSFC